MSIDSRILVSYRSGVVGSKERWPQKRVRSHD